MSKPTDGWLEVLRTGTHTAASGEKVTIDNAFIDGLAARYNPSYHEAPLVLGHPKDNSPSFGWVESVKSEGGKLLARLKQVAPELRDWVRDGRFKHRSASLYADLDGKGPYLRHIGFLGAAPPAIKGLAPVSFSDGEAVLFEFEERSDDMDESKIRQMFAEFAEKITNAISSTVGKLKPAGTDGGGPSDVQKQIDDAVKAATADVTKQFSEKITGLETQLGDHKKQLTAAEETQRRASIHSFADQLKAKGKWVPAFESMHLKEFMEALPSGEGAPVIEFSETETKDGKTTTTTVKQSPLQFFQDFLEKLPKIVEFGEMTAGLSSARSGSNVLNFRQPEDERYSVENVDLAERTVQIQREKKISFEDASMLARQELQAS